VPEITTQRISRELFIAAVAGGLGPVEPWVTDRLAEILEEDELGTGECVFDVGDSPDYFYFLRHGRVEIVGGGAPPFTIDSPRAFGLLDGLAERPRTRKVTALAPTLLLRVRVDAWLELLEDSFDLARMALWRGIRNVAALEERSWASHPGLTPPATAIVTAGKALDAVDRLTVLMQVPYLRGGGAQPISDLASVCREVSYGPDEPVLIRGGRRDELFVIVEGRVSAQRGSPDVAWKGGPGQLVAGVATLGERGRDWEARAVTATRVLTFSVEDWFDVMEENFELVRATLEALATEMERLGGEP